MTELNLTRVGKIYPGPSPTTALKEITVTIRQGDFVAIEGSSGGGKSTLLNIIGLLDRPTSGHYAVDGLRLEEASERRISRTRSDTFAFIFQAFHLLERRPAIDSVELGLLYRGLPRKERRERALAALEAVNIRHLAYKTVGKLSGGQRQRVAIARALSAGAPIIAADEPTGNLDSANGEAVIDALRHAHESGTTIILVTHSPEAASAAEYRLALRDGTLTGATTGRGEPYEKYLGASESGYETKGIHPGTSVTDSQPAFPRKTPRHTKAVTVSPLKALGGTPPGKPSTLRFRDLLSDAVSSITSRVVRSLSLVAAVALGIGLTVATLGLTVSASAQVTGTFNAHANRDVTVTWNQGDLNDETSHQQQTITQRLDQLAGVTASSIVTAYGGITISAAPDRSGFKITGYGETGAYEKASRSTITWAPGHAHQLREGEALLGQAFAQQLQLGPLLAAPRISANGTVVTVVGLITSSPRITDALGSIVFTDGTANKISGAGQVRALVLTTAGAAQQVARQAPLVIDPYSASSLQVDAPTDPTTLRGQIQGDVATTLTIFTGVALLASLAGLINTSILAVLERRYEFGLRRAVGARPAHIFSLVLVESVVLGLIGGLVGLAAGLGTVLAVTLINHWSPVMSLSTAPLALAGGILVGAAGGLAASLRAARIRPSEALRA